MVKTLRLEAPAQTLNRQFFGRVRARETVDLAFEVGGRLEAVLPEEGTRVAAGDVIARLSQDVFQRALARAEVQRDQSIRDAVRVRQLANQSIATKAYAEELEAARDLAVIAVQDAEADLEDATMVAPFDALVAARLTPVDTIVTQGQAILRLHDMSEVRVEIAMPEQLFVFAGGLAGMTFAASGPDGASLPLRLVAFRPDAASVGQTYLVTLAFTEDPGSALLPGASVTVTASLPSPVNGFTVPASAIIAENDRSAAVMVVERSGETLTVRRTPVEVGSATGTTFTVTGLDEDTEVVTAGAHRLNEGQTVRRFNGLQVAGE